MNSVILHLFCFFFFICFVANAANHTDGRQSTFKNEKTIQNLLSLADSISNNYPDSSLKLALSALQLADSLALPSLAAMANYKAGVAYLKRNQFSKGKAYLTKSLAYAQKNDDYKLEVKNLIGLAEIYRDKKETDSARTLIEHAKEVALKYNYKNALANLYNNLANISTDEGKIEQAITEYIKAAELFQEQDYPTALATVYSNIGMKYKFLKNYPDAISYIMQAIEINKKENYLSGLQNNYNQLGIIYADIHSYEKARHYYGLALDIAQKAGDEYSMAKVFLNQANLLKKMKIFDTAELYFDSANFYCKKNNIIFGLALTEMNMGFFFNETGQSKKALKKLREIQNTIIGFNIPDLQAAFYSGLSHTFKELKIYDSALYYYELYTELNDSIAGLETQNTVLELERKYQSEHKAREIAELEESLLAEKLCNKAFLAGLILAGILITLLSLLIIARRRANKLAKKLAQQEYLELKNTMELRNQELLSKALMVSNLNEQLDTIHKHVRQIKPELSKKNANKLDILMKSLEVKLPEHAWNEFETWFDKVHQGFFQQLMLKYPELSPTEMKVCSLLRLNMSTKDIALLTNRSSGTVDNIRYRIRKKMDLSSDDNLATILLNL